MRLPGLSMMVAEPTEAVRKFNQQESRNRALLRAQLREEDFKASPPEAFAVGDVVLRVYTDYERQHHPGAAVSAAMRFVPKWSLPCKIVEVKKETALVREVWANTNVEPTQVSATTSASFCIGNPYSIA